jgi:hypothetical protein
MTLSQVLRSNATFSLLTGLAALAMPDYFCRNFALSNPLIFQLLGAALLFFAATVFYAAVNPFDKPKQVLWIVIQDGVWVAASAAIVLFRLFDMSDLAYISISIIALIVATFGYFQYKCLSENK